MSNSLKRVKAALATAGIDVELREMTTETRTAQQAADAAGCDIDQILKSIIFRGDTSGQAILFMTAGGRQVDNRKAAALANEPLGKADAALIRTQTGFAIGGVAPIGHLSPITAFFDSRLLDFDLIWAAAGTPRHIFSASPMEIRKITNSELSDFTI